MLKINVHIFPLRNVHFLINEREDDKEFYCSRVVWFFQTYQNYTILPQEDVYPRTIKRLCKCFSSFPHSGKM